MLSNLVKTGLKRSHRVGAGARMAQLPTQMTMKPQQLAILPTQVRTYYQDNVLMPREYGDGYFSDPVVVAERIVRLIAQHDSLSINPSDITVGQSFDELGLNELDMCEVMIMIEREFDFEVSEDDCETFTTINDIVENVARNFYAK